jgi:arsenite methyltransferase
MRASRARQTHDVDGSGSDVAHDEPQVLVDIGVIGDYGIDNPRAVRILFLATIGAGLIMLFAAIANAPGLPLAAFGACVLFAVSALSLIWSSRVGRVKERVPGIDRLDLAETSYVLDAGCGRGIMLVEAAHRVPEGLAVGVDVWHAVDEALVRPEDPLRNAQLEGVGERVVVTTGDITMLPFPEGMFDAVVCSLVLGRLTDRARLVAVRELARVLVPGGRLLVFDAHRSRRLMIALRSVDLANVARSKRVWRVSPPARYVTATKQF